MNIYTGVPGSGKTFLAVKYLAETYFDYDKKFDVWTQKNDKKDYTIFTNITNLSLPGVKDLPAIFKKFNTNFDDFFHIDYQKKLHEKYPKIVYVIDEVQQFMPYRYSKSDTILYFDMHRHYGDEIILITQNLMKLNRSISTLAEFEFRAVQKTFSLLGEFKYNVKSQGEIFKRIIVKSNKNIFNLYQSFQGDNQNLMRNNLKYYIIFLIIAFFSFGYYFYHNRLGVNNDHFHGHVAQLSPKTAFANETTVPRETKNQFVSPIPKKLPERFMSVQIISWVSTSNDIMLGFIDPITGRYFLKNNHPYKIIFVKPNYYIVIKQSDYDKIKSTQA